MSMKNIIISWIGLDWGYSMLIFTRYFENPTKPATHLQPMLLKQVFLSTGRIKQFWNLTQRQKNTCLKRLILLEKMFPFKSVTVVDCNHAFLWFANLSPLNLGFEVESPTIQQNELEAKYTMFGTCTTHKFFTDTGDIGYPSFRYTNPSVHIEYQNLQGTLSVDHFLRHTSSLNLRSILWGDFSEFSTSIKSDEKDGKIGVQLPKRLRYINLMNSRSKIRKVYKSQLWVLMG